MATIGSGGAPSQNTVNYDALLSTTLAAYRDTMVDNVFKDSAYLAYLREYGGIEKQNGGERIAQPLMYGNNSTIKSYQGEETLNTTLQDGMTTAFFEWKEVAGTIGITRREERQNSGEGQIMGLLQKKVVQAEMGIREELNRQLVAGTVSSATFVPGNSAKDLYSLGYFFRKDNTTNPTTGGNVGNISAAVTNEAGTAWWRHQTATAASGSTDTGNAFALNVSTYAGFKAALYRMYNTCSKGSGGSPDLLLFDQISFETYNNSLDKQIQYLNTKMADMGFDTIKLRGATCLWDEQVPDISSGTLSLTLGSVFFINSKFYKLVIDSETDFVTTPFIEPENQTVKTAKILFMGNATVSNMRKHGVVYGVSRTITS